MEAEADFPPGGGIVHANPQASTLRRGFAGILEVTGFFQENPIFSENFACGHGQKPFCS